MYSFLKEKIIINLDWLYRIEFIFYWKIGNGYY